MLRVMLMRKRQTALEKEEAELRSRLAGFETRTGEIAEMVESASTDEEVAAATAAVEELEEQQKTTKERLEAVVSELQTVISDIEAAEAAAAAAAASETDTSGEGEEGRSERGVKKMNHEERRRIAAEFQRTGKTQIKNVREFVRAALLSTDTIGPTKVGGINAEVGTGISSLIDQIKITDCTGFAAYKVAYEKDTGAEAATFEEGTVPTEIGPAFGSVTLMPDLVGAISYVSKEIRKTTPLNYEEAVYAVVRKALRRSLSKRAVSAIYASDLNTSFEVTTTAIGPSLLSDIILSYGGDEDVEGVGTLILNKADLKAFAAVRGKNEYLPVYSIIPDASNPSTGVIKDNNGLSCRYIINKNVPSIATAGAGVASMIYGNLQSLEMGLWGDLEVAVSEDYKFGEGLLTVRGEVMAAAAVTVKGGFVTVKSAE